MTRKPLVALAAIFWIAAAGAAAELNTLEILGTAWPSPSPAKISEIGRGIGVVFSPDLSVPDNCHFYEALGFACFQTPDWSAVLDGITAYNTDHPDARITTLVLETHGTNGNGLKLQTSYAPKAERSYVAVGALQERLEPVGVANIIISACNSGRLLRPYIHNHIDRNNGDRLFLPATLGIIDASPTFDDSLSAVTVITPESSHIETTLVASLRELSIGTRQMIAASAAAKHLTLPRQFAISDIMMQILTRDSGLQLAVNHEVDQLSAIVQPQDHSEELFVRFKTYLKAVAAREGATEPVVITHAKRKRRARR
ncbi:MAG TPA: hypothetical protein VJ853_11755 [Thermoanaerobaculia bacterium]|nr:hypothetical protein [Thermoanaerobaculia bacterium]